MRMIINSIYRILHSARMADSLVSVQEDSWGWIHPHEPIWLWSLKITWCWPTVTVSAHSPPQKKTDYSRHQWAMIFYGRFHREPEDTHHTLRVSALPSFPRHRPPPLLLQSDNHLLSIQHRHQRGKRQPHWVRLSNRGFSKLGTGKKKKKR